MAYVKLRRLKHKAAQDGGFLAEWLNSEDGWGYSKKAQCSIVSLLEQLLSLKDKKTRKAQEEALVPINSILERYPWTLRVLGTHRGVPVITDWPSAPPKNFQWATQSVIWLARQQLLDRVRRCGWCKIWFYARVPSAEFHSTKCRQAHHRSTPEYKEKNRKYQRKYYRDKLSPITAEHLQWKGKNRHAKKK